MEYEPDYSDAKQVSPRNAGPIAEASSALTEAQNLHKMLGELELRLFGPEPKSVGDDAVGSGSSPALAHTLKHTRQRLESANSRLGQIIGRL